MDSDPIETNANFQRVLEELTAPDLEVSTSPSDDPRYRQFIQKFPAAKISNLTLSEYCVGKGDGQSFCWWLERGLQPLLGRYMPGTSRGHILYFQKDGAVYKHRHLREMSDQAALEYTLKIQACIAQADIQLDLSWIDDDGEIYRRAGVEARVTVGHGRKLRLLASYHPDQLLPIASSAHLGHFLQVLGCPATSIPPQRQAVARMLLLRRYYELVKEAAPSIGTHQFVATLYSERLDFAPKKEEDAADDAESEATSSLKPTSRRSAISAPAQPLNQILYGPPGTGKTYATIEAALSILDAEFLAANLTSRQALKDRFKALSHDQRVQFVTFHQSFSYEDFVEGIRAVTDEETQQLRYEVVDGVFKTLCNAAQALATPQERASVSLVGKRIWKMSLGDIHGTDADVFDDCIANNHVLLGYGANVDFTGCTTKEEVAERYKQRGISIGSTERNYAVASVLTFVSEMSKGDLVVVSDGNLKFRAIGEVVGDYELLPEPDSNGYAQMRKVRWLRQYEPSLPYAELMNKRFNQMTLYELRSNSIDLSRLQHLLNGQGPSELAVTLGAGAIGTAGYVITRVTDDMVQLSKPNGNELTFSRKMLDTLADGVRNGTITIEDIRGKSAIDKLQSASLEPYLVNGYNNILAPMVERLAKGGWSMSATFGSSDARVLIIDEINRGNISRVFGELITLIEPSKRAGAQEELDVILPYSKQRFSVPQNVFLIGTMNTADRSLTSMDVALRRRFVFKEMQPKVGVLKGMAVGAVPIDELLRVMNERMEALLGRDHCLGHAYFLPLRDDPSLSKLAEIFRVQILPLLQEYFFDDWQRIRWVLNDHRKSAAFQFISSRDIDSNSLFGDDVDVGREPRLWKVEDDAFLSEQSYLGVIDHKDAT